MALPHKSVATIDNIEFVNLSPLDISPLMSKCEIKVFIQVRIEMVAL